MESSNFRWYLGIKEGYFLQDLSTKNQLGCLESPVKNLIPPHLT